MHGDGRPAESAWTPLSHPVFRALWIASLVSNIGTWMQNVSAAWAMTSLSPSPLMVALVQSATSLPVFLVGLPAGAVADIVDRRRLLLVTQCWMLVAAGLVAVLVRLGLFIVCASAFWALLPVITRRDLGLGAFGYGLLLGCLGVGAIAGAALLPRVKRRLPLDAVIGLATVAFAVVSALTAFWRFIPGLGIAMILGGVAWIAMMAGLNGSAQTAVPAWVRARALGIYLLVFQGGLGLGSVLWGFVAEHVGASIALASSAGGALLGLAAIRRWPLRAMTTLDLTPSAHWPEPHLDVVPAPDEGPVRVEVEYRIDPAQADTFALAIRDLEPIRRRDGAVNWAVYQDPGQKGRYVESFIVESWVEHLRQHERVTLSDRAVEERIRRFHVAATPPAVTHLIAAH